jgi:hypothetical protein
MSAYRSGVVPAKNYGALFARAATAALLAALGGCATNSATTTSQYSGSHVQVADVAADVEDDGLPAQTPPPAARVHQAPDDPTQPFSRNYGGVNPSASAAPLVEGPVEHQAPTPKVPKDLPLAFRQKLMAALAEDE